MMSFQGVSLFDSVFHELALVSQDESVSPIVVISLSVHRSHTVRRALCLTLPCSVCSVVASSDFIHWFFPPFFYTMSNLWVPLLLQPYFREKKLIQMDIELERTSLAKAFLQRVRSTFCRGTPSLRTCRTLMVMQHDAVWSAY